ncbi:pirin family protein [Sulfurovum sp. CS9]|uniref:pirin family protein n=1 Tax=Sulfurovum sp. CS9 TaxID=3391146 RepID=UPI0039EA01F9
MIEVLHRNDLPLGGFAGLKEYRLVMNPKLFGQQAAPYAWDGIGNLVYLADARFDPEGETHMHHHEEIDVISVIVEGQIEHQGTLGAGELLKAGDVQVQRAGGNGFSHNEINPDNTRNRMIQLWVLPEHKGEAAEYRLYKIEPSQVTRVYGGENDQDDTLASHTTIEIVSLSPSQVFILKRPFLAYLTEGKGTNNTLDFEEGDLIKADQIYFKATSDVTMIVMQAETS